MTHFLHIEVNTIFLERKWSGEISLGFDLIRPRFPRIDHQQVLPWSQQVLPWLQARKSPRGKNPRGLVSRPVLLASQRARLLDGFVDEGQHVRLGPTILIVPILEDVCGDVPDLRSQDVNQQTSNPDR